MAFFLAYILAFYVAYILAEVVEEKEEDEEEVKEGRKEGRKEGAGTAVIKSNNPHLAGGKKGEFKPMVLFKGFCHVVHQPKV